MNALGKSLKASAQYLLAVLVIFLLFDLFSGFLLASLKLNPMFWALFPWEFTMHAQTSKSGISPDKPVVILGDSYAAGAGDWYNSQKNQLRIDQFHSAHTLHDISGRDVISFGSTGAGSPRAYAEALITAYRSFQHSWFFKLDEPDSIILYFYEGNDLQDNLEWIAAKSRCYEKFDYAKTHDANYIKNYLYKHTVGNKIPNDQGFRKLIRNFTVSYAIYNKINPEYGASDGGYKCSPYMRPGRVVPEMQGKINKASINGQTLQLPDHIQAPPVELTTEQRLLSLEIFRQSLSILRDAYPDKTIGLLFLPSVASSYQLESNQVHHQNYLGKQALLGKTEQIISTHNATVSVVKDIAGEFNIRFKDATPYLKKTSATQLIHGPTDWNHLNQSGYQALGRAAADLLGDLNK